MRLTIIFATISTLLFGFVLAQDEEEKQDPPKKPTIEELIEQLADDAWKVRENAQKALEKMGKEIVPKLKEALEESDDPEVRGRLRDVITKLTEAAKKLPGNTERMPEDPAEAAARLRPYFESSS